MMMTSGSGVDYKSMFDAGFQIIAKEGTALLFRCQYLERCCWCGCAQCVRSLPGSCLWKGLLWWIWLIGSHNLFGSPNVSINVSSSTFNSFVHRILTHFIAASELATD
ncbi:hypothetical protein F5878DRAFT_620151 [Lentinula raphanica]|uniref:Uncharacterized protein n=1 Tax=Lentinula raphanica TaxID=153919 RepID=A0AA38P8D7_9AGAR|nr:hypothetical protein F5878DRAFT_620151 [Lentinula raphanica]